MWHFIWILGRPQGGVPGACIFHNIQAHQSDSTASCNGLLCLCYTTLPATVIALPIHQPGGKYTGKSLQNPLLHQLQHPTNYSLQSQRYPTPSHSISRYPKRSLDMPQTLLGESLAVLLRTEPTQDDFCRWGRCYQAEKFFSFHIWYHIWYLSNITSYDIIVGVIITVMISLEYLWHHKYHMILKYHIWYHDWYYNIT